MPCLGTTLRSGIAAELYMDDCSLSAAEVEKIEIAHEILG